ncbi:MAG: metallo-dependent phosphatase, partial [Pseudomonadales bacterium]|nr:metallo-dependent phosphatase [Pseudomonadales bacterium]
VRVLGCTLWSDFLIDGQEGKQDAIQTCRSRVMDYRLIQYGDKQFTPEDSMDLMNDHLKWLRGELDQDFSGKTVVMTHHCPSIYFVQEQYLSSNLKGAFVSDLHRIIEQYPIDLWVCGHVHYNVDVTLAGTRLVSNCRGYPKENIPWDNCCVLTL